MAADPALSGSADLPRPGAVEAADALDALLRELDGLERRAGRLEGQADALVREHARARDEFLRAHNFLELAPKAQARLEELSRDLFGELMEEVESNLTHGVREILGQDRVVKSRREVKNGKLHITLEIENQGQAEDVLAGQGGSVCNILSVGLRLIGLAQLDPGRHQRFLVLDEQDCWLRPELVPAFTRIIAAIGEKLELQVLYISHHSVDMLNANARRVFVLTPDRTRGVAVNVLDKESAGATGEEWTPGGWSV